MKLKWSIKTNHKQWQTSSKFELGNHGKWDPKKIHHMAYTFVAGVTGGGVRGGSSGDLRHIKLHLMTSECIILIRACPKRSCASGTVRIDVPSAKSARGLGDGGVNGWKIELNMREQLEQVTKWLPKGGQREPKGSPKGSQMTQSKMYRKTHGFYHSFEYCTLFSLKVWNCR